MADDRKDLAPQAPTEPTQPDPALKEGPASRLRVAAVFGGAAALILVFIYGINNQHPVLPTVATGETTAQAGAEPDLPTVPGSAPRTADEAAEAASPQDAAAPAAGGETQGAAPAPGTETPADQPDPSAADAGQPGQPGVETEGAAPPTGTDSPAAQPERGAADRGQPGRAAGDTPSASHPAERQSGAEERLNQ